MVQMRHDKFSKVRVWIEPWIILATGPLTNLINYVHDRGRYVLSDGDNFGVFSCGENDGENDGENTVKLLWEITVKILWSTVMTVRSTFTDFHRRCELRWKCGESAVKLSLTVFHRLSPLPSPSLLPHRFHRSSHLRWQNSHRHRHRHGYRHRYRHRSVSPSR